MHSGGEENGQKAALVGEYGVLAEEREAAGRVRRHEHLKEQAAEQARKHADGEEEGGPARDPPLAVGGQAAAWHDHVQVWMVGERRAPGV